MRTAYREQMDNFAHDLIIMCDTVHQIMHKASEALLSASLEPAEDALSLSDSLEEIRARCEERAVQLLALENPMAKDLRVVVSSIYIVEDLYRMAALAGHVAKNARRRHPDHVVPERFRGYFAEMARLVADMDAVIHELLIDPDADVALKLTTDDDMVDDINTYLLSVVTRDDWSETPREAVEIAMLCRFYERYADHCVNVAARVVYLSTGLVPEEYLAKREIEESKAEVNARLEKLEREFHR